MIYLKIKDIKGNCTEAGFIEQIKVDSFSHGLSNPLTARPGNTERTSDGPAFSEMNFSKTMDSSSPSLYQACAGNQKLGEAVISVVRVEADKVMSTVQYTLGDAMISGISTSGSADGGLPQESFSINFTTITSSWTQQNADSTKKGVAPFGWDLKEGKPLAPPAA
jgi:type VI secretion system secreted protein Hcp